jgi:hypothetical protein
LAAFDVTHFLSLERDLDAHRIEPANSQRTSLLLSSSPTFVCRSRVNTTPPVFARNVRFSTSRRAVLQLRFKGRTDSLRLLEVSRFIEAHRHVAPLLPPS